MASSQRRITIRDVAARAGVSTTTVSHALNGKGRIDPATRDRVLDAASSLGLFAGGRGTVRVKTASARRVAIDALLVTR